MKKIHNFIFVFLILAVAVSCASKKHAEPVLVETTKTITQIERDTVFSVKADSSFYKAYIDCVNGRPVVRNEQSQPGTNLKAPKVVFKDRFLQVDCKIDSSKIALKWWETNTTIQEPKIIYLPKEVPVEKPLNWWQKTQMTLGRLMAFQIILFIIYLLIKFLKK